MPTHITNELTFDLPDVLKDKTHHIFSVTDEGPSAFSVVISKSAVGDEETLQSYGERLAAELKRSLPRFESISARAILISDQPAWGLEYRWLNQGQWLHQRQANLFHVPESGRKQMIQITATVAGQFTDEWKRVFATLLGSIRMRPPDSRDGPSHASKPVLPGR
jgi:hypothetical protein